MPEMGHCSQNLTNIIATNAFKDLLMRCLVRSFIRGKIESTAKCCENQRIKLFNEQIVAGGGEILGGSIFVKFVEVGQLYPIIDRYVCMVAQWFTLS